MNLGQQRPGLPGVTGSLSELLDASLDVAQGFLSYKQNREAHRLEGFDLALIGCDHQSDYKAWAKRDDLFDIRR
jgi:hypothetical protein